MSVNAALLRTTSGFVCTDLVRYDYQSEIFTRACGRCRRCCARIMRDISGRAAAEAYTSAEVVAFTLTYRNEHKGHKDFCDA